MANGNINNHLNVNYYGEFEQLMSSSNKFKCKFQLEMKNCDIKTIWGFHNVDMNNWGYKMLWLSKQGWYPKNMNQWKIFYLESKVIIWNLKTFWEVISTFI